MERRRFLLLPVLAPIVAAPLAVAALQRDYVLATASPGGTFHPVGLALAALITATLKESDGLALTAATTAGSEQNVWLLRSGEAHFAILQGLVGSDAWSGRGAFADGGTTSALRSLTGLWPNVEQFVIRSEHRETGTMDDLVALKGRRLALGSRGSGTLASSGTLIGNLGADIERDFELVHLGYGPAADALRRGDVAAIALPAGLPTKSLARLKSEMGEEAVILEFTPDQAERADGGRRLWHPYRIPAGTYPGQSEDVRTIAQPNFLAVREDVPEQDAYLIVRAIFENLPILGEMHEATRAIALDTALSGLPMPLHRGAGRFFREKGLTIPGHLLVD